jgi:hypothetical protein
MEHGIKVKANLFFCSYLIFESDDRHFLLINLKVFCQHTSMEKEKESSFTLKTAAYFATAAFAFAVSALDFTSSRPRKNLPKGVILPTAVSYVAGIFIFLTCAFQSRTILLD